MVAYDLKRGIGANNDLLWQRDLPADLKHFKELTSGQTVIMGHKTYESIGRPLPNRQNIVVSRQDLAIEGILTVHALAEAYQLAEHEIFIIGGGSIYEQALADVDTIYATEVQAEFPQATVFFPSLPAGWQETSREQHEADERNKYAYEFVTFTKS